MISANEARQRTEEMRVKNFRREIEKTIKYSVDKGKTDARISGKIPPEIILELMEKRYSVEELKGITKISW